MVRTNRPNRPQRPPFNLVRCLIMVLISLIIIVGLVILITWLVVRPKRVHYSIEDASISNFHQTDTHLNSTFNFEIRATNPNRWVSVYYDSVESSVIYNHDTVAFSKIEPFFQGHRNETRVKTKMVAWNAALSAENAGKLKAEKKSGEVEFEVHVKARIRVRVGIWKSGHRSLKLTCLQVMIPFSSAKHFQRTRCETDL